MVFHKIQIFRRDSDHNPVLVRSQVYITGLSYRAYITNVDSYILHYIL